MRGELAQAALEPSIGRVAGSPSATMFCGPVLSALGVSDERSPIGVVSGCTVTPKRATSSLGGTMTERYRPLRHNGRGPASRFLWLMWAQLSRSRIRRQREAEVVAHDVGVGHCGGGVLGVSNEPVGVRGGGGQAG